MKDEIIRMIFGILICGTFAGGLFYLNYSLEKNLKKDIKKDWLDIF